MDIRARRADYVQKQQQTAQAIQQAVAFLEQLKGAIAVLDEQIAESEKVE